MKPFAYTRATDMRQATEQAAREPRAKFIAGGTNLVDLMKEGVEQPDRLIDITRLGLEQIEELPGGGVRIGALARNSDVAEHALIRARFPVLAQALLAGASAQLRNLATVGGNLLQRTRCYYLTDVNMPCNKRVPGSGCGALEGFNRIHAILGASDKCIATHPSDMCVALVALEAVVRTELPGGQTRALPILDFHRLPGDTPDVETILQPGELITSVELPASAFAARSRYLKVRDRASYAFALVSVAAALDLQNGVVRAARVALGGVAHKPWRALEAERLLTNAPATPQLFARAAEAAVKEAKPQEYNAFKIPLAKRTIVRALTTLANNKGGAA